MNNIYFVYLINDYSDIILLAIYRNQDEAVQYAQTCDLEHDDFIYVEERYEGVQDRYNPTIYERRHYDHTQVLFSTVCWYDYGLTLSLNQVVAKAVRQASPLLTQDVDFDRLYQLYIQEYCYEED